MLQLKEAPAGRRAGGAGGPAAGDGRGQRRAARAGDDRDPAVIRCWRVPGAVGGRPAAGSCLGVVLASVGTAARRRRVRGGRHRPGAAAEGGAGRAPSWRSRWASSW
ncbi:hypothetical protein LJR269_006715 [Duganella sp. LjRoot269]